MAIRGSKVVVGLVAAVVQAQIDDTLNDVVDVRVVDSLNNLRALNNVLSNNDVDVTVGDVSILTDFLNKNDITLEDFLNDLDLEIGDVTGVSVLENGDIIGFI